MLNGDLKYDMCKVDIETVATPLIHAIQVGV